MRLTSPRLTATLTLATLLPAPAFAADLTVSVEIPRLDVAEYHRPYVAIWLEGPDRAVTNLAVWYDLKMRNGEGSKWLKDLRQWWRKSGRELAMPVDGISGATQPPGEHEIVFDEAQAPLTALAAGDYELVVEAAREVGGRELVRLPFQWPPQGPQTQEVRGEHELGAVTLQI